MRFLHKLVILIYSALVMNEMHFEKDVRDAKCNCKRLFLAQTVFDFQVFEIGLNQQLLALLQKSIW